MRLLLHILALVSAVFAAEAWYGGGGNSQPSSTPWTGYVCPDNDRYGHAKISYASDSSPYRSSMFGCTYHTGYGVGTYVCKYDVYTGRGPSDQDSRCPSTATHYSGRKKRSPPSAAAPTPGDSYAKRNIIRGSREAAELVQ